MNFSRIKYSIDKTINILKSLGVINNKNFWPKQHGISKKVNLNFTAFAFQIINWGKLLVYKEKVLFWLIEQFIFDNVLDIKRGNVVLVSERLCSS